MARKGKKNEIQDLPVDKIDLFFKDNFKKMVLGAFIIIMAFIATYTVRSFIASSQAKSSNTIGFYEISGLYTKEQIAAFSGLAKTHKYAKDYIHMTAALRYVAAGYFEQARQELLLVGGAYKEFADSLSYDLGFSADIKPEYLKSGYLSYVWNYRAVLASKDAAEAKKFLNALVSKQIDNGLLAKLEDWGI